MAVSFNESGFTFVFSDTDHAEVYDKNGCVPDGMKSVDFVVEQEDRTLFLEIKNYHNKLAAKERIIADKQELNEALNIKGSLFCHKIGMKIKDSILRKYALGQKLNKRVVFLLVINNNDLDPFQRMRLYEKLSGYIPTGLNKPEFPAFTKIFYDILCVKDLPRYGINCIETI
jgi:hypothetical protein